MNAKMRKGKKEQEVLSVNQRKITTFFSSAGTAGTFDDKTKGSCQHQSRSRDKKLGNGSQAANKAKGDSKIDSENEVILLSDSESDDAKNSSRSTAKTEEGNRLHDNINKLSEDAEVN